MRLLVTRPQPQAGRTAARLRALGHDALLSPLLEVRARDWTPPATLPQAVLFTSAAALRMGGDGLAALHTLPAFAVGAATAAMMTEQGFADVRSAAGDASAALALVAAHGFTQVLHLAGVDRSAVACPAGLTIDVREVYAAQRVARLSEAAIAALGGGSVDFVLLYSARTAVHFAQLLEDAGIARAKVGLAALSPAILTAAGAGWRTGIAASAPHEDSLFAAIGLPCDKAPSTKAE